MISLAKLRDTLYHFDFEALLRPGISLSMVSAVKQVIRNVYRISILWLKTLLAEG